MMGSPQMAIKLPLLMLGTALVGSFLGSDFGRQVLVKWNHSGEHDPGKSTAGCYSKKADMKTYYNELEALRKVNVQPIWDENKTSEEMIKNNVKVT